MTEEAKTTAEELSDHKQSADFVSAFRSVPATEKRRAYFLLGAAGVTLAVCLLSRLLWLFEPVLDLIYYATLSEIIYYILIGIIFTVYIVFLNKYVKKHTGERIFLPDKRPMSVTSVLGIIAICAVAVFFTGLGFKFRVKIEVEMGKGVTMATALTNIAVYFYYAFHLWLGLTAAALIQRGLTILLPSRYTVPWGAIALVTLFGLTEFIFEFGTTPHVYPWLYYIFTYVYAAIYTVSGNRFHVTYWAAIVVLVL